MPGLPDFGQAEFDAVRAAVDLRLTEDSLSNETIGQGIFEGEGRRYVTSAISEAIIDTNLEIAKNIAVLRTAALILPSLPSVTREEIPGGMMWFEPREVLKAAAERQKEAEILLAVLEALDPSATTLEIPTMFTVGNAPCQ